MLTDKHMPALESAAAAAFMEMARIRTETYMVKATRSSGPEAYVTAVTAKLGKKDPSRRGQLMLGFHDRRKALRLASLIARGHDLSPFKKFDDGAAQVAREYLSEVVDAAGPIWMKAVAGLTVAPARPLVAPRGGGLKKAAQSTHIITLKASGEAIALFATIHELVASCLRGKKVLVADDSRVIRMVLAKEFHGQGCTVLEATDGQEAVAVCLREHPDLTIMDLVMPQMDGLNAIAAIRKSDPACPIIVLTSSAKKSEILAAASLGVRNYVKKPIKPALLIAAAEDCFK